MQRCILSPFIAIRDIARTYIGLYVETVALFCALETRSSRPQERILVAFQGCIL
jgi:hypothetical protein